MLNHLSVQSVGNSHFGDRFRKPLYDSYCFSKIPETIKLLLTGESSDALPVDVFQGASPAYDQFVLLFIDGFGWCFYNQYHERYPFLKRFRDQGVVSKISAQFPSTTACHVTCMHTGKRVWESGNYEWFHYDPTVDAIIAPLLYSFAGDKELNTLKSTGVTPGQIYPASSLYKDLADRGVESFVLQHESIAFSTYSQAVCQGAKTLAFSNLQNALEQLLSLMQNRQGRKTYYILYWGDIDSIGHRHGPCSPQFEKAVDSCFNQLEEFFWKKYKGIIPNSAIAVTADHGQIPTTPQTSLYINQMLPEVQLWIKKNKKGQLLVPAGSPRDLFLHIKEDALEEAFQAFSKLFAGRAEVYLTKDLVSQGLFGPEPPSQRFNERIGNLVILPYKNESIFWYEEGRFYVKFLGNHGGLTPEELETIFLFHSA